MNILKISFSIIYWLIILALVVIATSTALSIFKAPGGISLFSVQSGSMEPTIATGSVVLTQKQANYNESDIITFLGKDKKDTTTHRILATKNANGEKIFTTKGDANRGEDRETIKENQILGKMFFSAPYLGYVVSFAKTQMGFIFLIIVPAVIIIFSEILNIKKEILKIIEKRKIPGGTTKILTLVLLIGAILILSNSTKAYLSDKEKSDNNVLQTGTWGTTQPSVTPTITPTLTQTPTLSPTPTGIANHAVISEVQITGGPSETNNDFIELYNPTNSDINLGNNNYRLVKRSGSSTNDTNIVIFSSLHIIPAHGFFLWANSGFSSISVTPNVTTTDILAASNSIALRENESGPVVDALSWNSAVESHKEGTEFFPDPGPNQSMERKALSTSDATSMTSGADISKGNGFDLNNNSTDFILRSASQPQNSSSSTESL